MYKKIVKNEIELEYKIERKNIKNLNLKVKPNKKVSISVPIEYPDEKIKEFILKKFEWIEKNINTNYDNAKENINFKSGETIFLLGKQYKLLIKPDLFNIIELKGKMLIIHIKEKYIDSYKYISKIYEKWLKDYSYAIIYEVLENYISKVNINIDFPELEIRKMEKRWGSCIRKTNKIIVNSRLIKTPICCIEYVILHELTHFKYINHDKNFYNFINIYMPDWKKRKEILDEEFVGIL